MKEAKIWKVGKNKVVTQTPYNEKFVNFARSQQGKWSHREKTWTFTDISFEIMKTELEKHFEAVKIGKIQEFDPFNFDTLREEKHEWQQLSKELQDYFLERVEILKEFNGNIILGFGFSIALGVNAIKIKNGFKIEDTAIVYDTYKYVFCS